MENTPPKPRILVDADSFPLEARKFLQKAARRLNLELIYYANRKVDFEIDSPLFSMVLCAQEKDAADDKIVEDSNSYDLTATRDILLAKRLVEKGITVINDRGVCFTKDNLPKYLEQREESMLYSELGLTKSKGHSSYGKKELHDFAACFDRIMTSLLPH